MKTKKTVNPIASSAAQFGLLLSLLGGALSTAAVSNASKKNNFYGRNQALKPAPLTSVSSTPLASTSIWPEKLVSLTLESTYTTNNRDPEVASTVASAGQDLFINFHLPYDQRLNLHTGAAKSVEGTSDDASAYDSDISWELDAYKGEAVNLTLSAKLILPTSESARDNTQMTAGYEVYPNFLFTLYNEDESAIRYRFRPVMQTFTYDSETRADGFYNIERLVNIRNRLQFQIVNWFSVYGSYDYITKWNTQGEHVDDTWASVQYLEFILSKNVYVQLVHSSQSTLFDAAGNRQSVAIFDDAISEYTALLGLTF